MRNAPELIGALEALDTELGRVELGLELPSAERARHLRDELAGQIDDYLLPRLRRMDAPLLMVVGGSTGAGKSTLVNSLVGSPVSTAGVQRPTTRGPVLALNPDDLHWFSDDRVLPDLARATGGDAGPTSLRLAPTPRVPSGLALLDAPDIDSVVAENRALGAQLLAAADAWLFVTTAARYADAVPWELLEGARERGTALAIVLNRVPHDAVGEVSSHLREMLRERGLDDAELLVVRESLLENDGLIPPSELAPVRRWLDALAADAERREALVRRTLTGALDTFPARVGVIEAALAEQRAAAEELRADVRRSYRRAFEEVDDAVRGGTLLRGEVLARWHEVVGTGDLMRSLESRIGWARDRIKSVLTGRPTAAHELEAAVESSVDAVVVAAADRAAERAARTWRDHPAGRSLVVPSLDAKSRELEERTRDEVRAWQGFVFDLVREEGMSKRTTARLASLGVNGAGLAVMLAVFAQTGGITGAEVVVAGGTSALGQKVLEAIFGDQAVRTLAARAREDLLERVERLLAAEERRFAEVLDAAAPDDDAVEDLHAAVRRFQAVR